MSKEERITVDSTTGETALRIDTRGSSVFAALSVATCIALMVVTGYATAWWFALSRQYALIDWSTANFIALQVPEVLIAACTYVVCMLPVAKRRLHSGIRDGVGFFGFISALSLLLNLI